MAEVQNPMLAHLRTRAGGRAWLRFDDFMDAALFAPGIGYYQTRKQRVGLTREADFFTATSVGPLFGELVISAATRLLGSANPSDYTFIEIGAEPDAAGAQSASGILKGVTHPFKQARTLTLNAPLALEGPCVVFSNELFDAQPCRRFLFRAGAWRELGVAIEGNALREIEIPPADLPPGLPANASEHYHLDLPLAAAALCRALARQPWHGLFLACDYGKSREELARHTPQGTVRAYHKHKQSNDLLAYPGEQDLTCHVCWDDLSDALAQSGFSTPTVESQEAFLIHHAARAIEHTMTTEASRMSQRKMALMQLLHPAHMGQKFQVLHALRPKS